MMNITDITEQKLVDAAKAAEMNSRARALMNEPEFYEEGYRLKCFLEELGLWEEPELTADQVLEYINLASRRTEIITIPHWLWKEEYGKELKQIDKRLQELRVLINAEHEKALSRPKQSGQ
jgi:hypothetical protein